MTSNYIYLLKEREFLKTKEEILKVGMTTKLNHERFNQYPKGSLLLFQMICKDSKKIEKNVLKKFRNIFKQRKDIGNEYFEGDYKLMIDIIYILIKEEVKEDKKVVNEYKEEFNESKEEFNEYEEEFNESEEDEEIYEITTYEEWKKYNEISKIIITNRNKCEGYLRFNGTCWRRLYDKSRVDWDDNYMEELSGYIEYNKKEVYKMVFPRNELLSYREMLSVVYTYQNKLTNEIISYDAYIKISGNNNVNYEKIKNEEYKFIHTKYEVNKILEDIVNKCYVEDYELYKKEYHEFVVKKECIENCFCILNTINFTFFPVDEMINNKILSEKECSMFCIINIKKKIDISQVDNILNILISN